MKLTIILGLMVAGFSMAAPANVPNLPAKLSCRYDKHPEMGPDILYTRLDKLKTGTVLFDLNEATEAEVNKDEVAFDWLGSYFTVSVDQVNWHYNVWTCDSEDRFYTIRLKEISDGRKAIKGTVDISIRDEGEIYAITCKAD